jgi:hypothetical protein
VAAHTIPHYVTNQTTSQNAGALVDDQTFVVSKEFPDVTFHYRVTGDTIRFDPVMPSCAPGCFEAVWSVMVAFPGKTWERVS